MKKIILLVLSAFPTAVLAQDGAYHIKGKIGEYHAPAKAYLYRLVAGKQIVDSALLEHGNFQFDGVISSPSRCKIVLDHQGVGQIKANQSGDGRLFYLDRGTIKFFGKDSVKNAVISDSRINDDDLTYKAMLAPTGKSLKAIDLEYAASPTEKKNNPVFMSGLRSRYDSLIVLLKKQQQDFIKRHPASYISLLAINDFAGQDIDPVVVEPLFMGLQANVRHSTEGIAYEKAIASARLTAVGATAPLFTLNDEKDQPVSLADFRGKYLLLDFWASWCGPCRAENPNVVKAFKKYKDKNFTVLGVSLDQPGKKDLWLAAIKADGLAWTQVSDLKFWDNAAAKAYGIRSIPQNYLIDPSGKIIAKNLRGEELEKKLSTLFNNN